MKVMITGGCGFIGQRLALRLLERGELAGPGGREEIERITLVDVERPSHHGPHLAERTDIVHLDICNVSMDANLPKTDVIFHLSSVLSGEGERDFNKAMMVNLEGTKGLLEAMRANGIVQRLVFASTLAVFGGMRDRAAPVGNSTRQAPLTTYGATKAISELLVGEYSRKGYVDGRSARLPTVIVREGRPNSAASSFCSDLIREPLKGHDAVLPVPRSQPMPLTSYSAAVEGLIALCEADASELPDGRAVGLPAINVTAGDIADCGARLAESRPGSGKVIERLDPDVAKICEGWPAESDNSDAERLGLPKPGTLDEIAAEYVRDYIEE